MARQDGYLLLARLGTPMGLGKEESGPGLQSCSRELWPKTEAGAGHGALKSYQDSKV